MNEPVYVSGEQQFVVFAYTMQPKGHRVSYVRGGEYNIPVHIPAVSSFKPTVNQHAFRNNLVNCVFNVEPQGLT